MFEHKMKFFSRQSNFLLLSAIVLGLAILALLDPWPVRADMGVQPILPGGSNIKPGEVTPIQMLAEKVVLSVRPATPADDTSITRNPADYGQPASFDGSPGMYPAMADVAADFSMFNPTDQAVSLTAWFPLTSALEAEAWDLLPGDVVPSITQFQVFVNGEPLDYTVSELPNPKGEDKPPLSWASFPVTFPAGEQTNVQISYTVPAWWSYDGLAMNLFYILQTGAGWAGPIGKAELEVKLPYPASSETIRKMPEGGEMDGNQVRWVWENLEPTPQDDFFIQLLMLNRWDELQAARAAVTSDPQDGEAWLNLATVYRTLTRGKSYAAARMLPGFGEVYQPQGIQAAQEAISLLPGDSRPHYELALFLASTLPEDASWDDLQPVLDELKIVEAFDPGLAPNIHDTLDFLGLFWAVETERAQASAMPEPSETIAPTPEATQIPTLIPSATTQPELATPQTVAEQVGSGRPVLLYLAGLALMFVIGYVVLFRLQGRETKK